MSLHVPLWIQAPNSRTLLIIFFGVPNEGALPPVSSHRAPSERDAPILEPSFTHLSKSTAYELPPSFPSGAPMERDARLQSPSLHILQGSQAQKAPPIQVPLTEFHPSF
jgi:hypothetical protein